MKFYINLKKAFGGKKSARYLPSVRIKYYSKTSPAFGIFETLTKYFSIWMTHLVNNMNGLSFFIRKSHIKGVSIDDRGELFKNWNDNITGKHDNEVFKS